MGRTWRDLECFDAAPGIDAKESNAKRSSTGNACKHGKDKASTRSKTTKGTKGKSTTINFLTIVGLVCVGQCPILLLRWESAEREREAERKRAKEEESEMERAKMGSGGREPPRNQPRTRFRPGALVAIL